MKAIWAALVLGVFSGDLAKWLPLIKASGARAD